MKKARLQIIGIGIGGIKENFNGKFLRIPQRIGIYQ
jgi:hypothetical protein